MTSALDVMDVEIIGGDLGITAGDMSPLAPLPRSLRSPPRSPFPRAVAGLSPESGGVGDPRRIMLGLEP